MTVVRDGGHVLIWFEDMVINLLKGELQKARPNGGAARRGGRRAIEDVVIGLCARPRRA